MIAAGCPRVVQSAALKWTKSRYFADLNCFGSHHINVPLYFATRCRGFPSRVAERRGFGSLFESVVRLLAPVLDELVLVGGCTAGIFVTDPAAGGIRPTRDVDAMVDVTSRSPTFVCERAADE